MATKKKAHPCRILTAQHRVAKASLAAAVQNAAEAQANSDAAHAALDTAQDQLRAACLVRYEARALVLGIEALRKLLATNDAAIIEAVLTDAASGSDRPDEQYRRVCLDRGYAQIGKINFGHVTVWTAGAANARAAWVALVAQGHLPELPQLLNQLAEAE